MFISDVPKLFDDVLGQTPKCGGDAATFSMILVIFKFVRVIVNWECHTTHQHSKLQEAQKIENSNDIVTSRIRCTTSVAHDTASYRSIHASYTANFILENIW